MWMMTDFREMPSQDDVDRFDEDWVNDLHLALMFYQHQNNKSGVMRLFEQMMAFKERGELVEAQRDMEEYYEEFDSFFKEQEKTNNKRNSSKKQNQIR